ncbi:Trans-1,2-dihydrobenzene-1,2-diol dehydrogenase [Camponotus japonicus]
MVGSVDCFAERFLSPEPMSFTLRWGIAGVKRVSHIFVSALRILPANEHKLIAVAAQEILLAQSFADMYNIPKIYDDYEKLASDADIDIVFIGTINSQRFDTVMLMLTHGKHVLCETPMTMSWQQIKELIICAQENQLFLMEAVAWRSSPAYDFIRKELASGNIGNVKSVEVYVGFNMLNTDQLTTNQMNDMIMDHIMPCLQFVCLVYNDEMPENILVFKRKDEDVTSIIVKLFYESIPFQVDRTANILVIMIYSSHLLNEAYIFAGNDRIKVPQFWCPIKVEVLNRSERLIFPILRSDTVVEPNFFGFSYLCDATHVHTCIENGLIQSPKMTLDTSLLLAMLKGEIRDQLDIVS